MEKKNDTDKIGRRTPVQKRLSSLNLVVLYPPLCIIFIFAAISRIEELTVSKKKIFSVVANS